MNRPLVMGWLAATAIGAAAAFAVEPPADAQRPANTLHGPAVPTATDEQLKAQLRGTSRTSAQNQADELLERAAGLMRSAGQRLQQGQTGEETRVAQQDAVAALDELIKRLEQPPPPDQNNSPPPPDSSQSPPPRPEEPQQNQQRQTSPERPDSSPNQHPPSQGGQSQDREHAEDSEDRQRERKLREAAKLKRKKLQTDVWGHLPEHLREQLLNTYSERMLPRYEDLVRQFYERLADTPTRKPSR